ncbi:MAG TPA: hypothetical protein VK131_10375 [Candidatus Acidoferrales bacterium]|nr:hypothetical protein [Candidatus Acidoferrales bacterium]
MLQIDGGPGAADSDEEVPAQHLVIGALAILFLCLPVLAGLNVMLGPWPPAEFDRWPERLAGASAALDWLRWFVAAIVAGVAAFPRSAPVPTDDAAAGSEA